MTEKQIRSEIERYILEIIQKIKYGAVEVVIHDSRIVHVEHREKIRFHGKKQDVPIES